MMEKMTMEKIVQRVQSDPTFRSRFMANPEVAITEANWDLPADDVAALQAWFAQTRGVTKLDELERSLTAYVQSRRPKAA